MQNLVDQLGGPAVVARMAGVRAPSVISWRQRGIPAQRCPAIERAVLGQFTCEQMRPDVHWHRVPDASWPHPQGRPLIDVAANSAQEAPSAV